MEFISAQMIKKNIKLNSLICEIENIYKNEYNVPLRQVYNINPKRSSDQMMLMPAFSRQGYYGVKVLNVFENNPTEDRPRVKAIYILYESKYGDQPKIQLNDKFSVVSDVGAYVLAERATKREELQNVLTTALKVDGETNMGLISDIKQELRKVNALKINYTTRIGDYTQNK